MLPFNVVICLNFLKLFLTLSYLAKVPRYQKMRLQEKELNW